MRTPTMSDENVYICPLCQNTADECIHDEAEGLRALIEAYRRDTVERVQRLIEHICWERFDCSREWAECDHGIARRLVEHVFPPMASITASPEFYANLTGVPASAITATTIPTWPEDHRPIHQRLGDTHGYWCSCGYASCDLDGHARHVAEVVSSPGQESSDER